MSPTKTKTTPNKPPTFEAAMEELRDVAARRAEAQAEAKRLYERQLELFVAVREGYDVQAKFREIADAVKGTVVGVDAAMRKIGEKRGSKVA